MKSVTKARHAAIVRSGTEADIRRLRHAGAQVLDRGARITVLQLAEDGSRTASEATVLAAWALVRLGRQEVLVLLLDGGGAASACAGGAA